MFSEYRREQEFHNIYKTYVLEKKKKDETQKKTLDQEFTDEINILQRRWNRESIGLEEMDKPARFVCFPMINALYDLMERMTDSLEDKTVETDKSEDQSSENNLEPSETDIINNINEIIKTSSSSKISTGILIGIVGGGVGLIVIITIIICCKCCKCCKDPEPNKPINNSTIESIKKKEITILIESPYGNRAFPVDPDDNFYNIKKTYFNKINRPDLLCNQNIYIQCNDNIIINDSENLIKTYLKEGEENKIIIKEYKNPITIKFCSATLGDISIIFESEEKMKDLIKEYFYKIKKPDLLGNKNIVFLCSGDNIDHYSEDLIKKYSSRYNRDISIIVNNNEDVVSNFR